MKLEKGMSFEVVEVLSDDDINFGIENDCFKIKGHTLLMDNGDLLANGLSVDNEWYYLKEDSYKPIGRLIIKEVK